MGFETVTDGTLRTIVNAVHASYAARVVDVVIFGIDARCFALARAECTAVTFCGVNHRSKERIF